MLLFKKVEGLKNAVAFTFEVTHGDSNISLNETSVSDLTDTQILDVINKFNEVASDIEEKNSGEKDDYDLDYSKEITVHGISIPVYEDQIHEGDYTALSLSKVIKYDENGVMFELDLSEL